MARRVIETKYMPASDTRGTSIKVIDVASGAYRIWRWDYAINGGPVQHQAAVRAKIDGVESIEPLDSQHSKTSYYWVVTTKAIEVTL